MTRRVGSLAPCLLFAVLAASAQADLPSDLQAITDGLAEETGVGALLCVEDAQGSFVLAAGSADSETPTAAKPTDRFRIASNGKSFTAAAILLLRDEGNLSLDDTVADLLPDHDIPSNDVITVRHLLTHTSGLPDHNNDTDYFESRALSNPATNFSPDEVFEVVRSLPSHFAPGEDWLYCDTGYYILHLIIEGENTNGWSYAEFIRHRLIEPLGLTNTFVPDDGNGFLRVIPGEHLDGYLLDEETGEITNVTEVGQSNDLGCGGMASSTEDLAKWIRALHDGAVLSAASQAEMETVTEQSRRTGHQYGMATVYSPLLGFGHSGVTLGYVSWMFYDPVRQTAYADVVNLESEDLLYTPMMALIEVKRALGYDDIADPRYSNTIAQVSAYVTNAMEEAGVPSLSIALVDSNRIVWARGFGLADREAGIEAHSDTTYLLCSISKTFTAAAILKLQEDGRVDLDDPVTNHIPDFALLPRFGGPPVTIRQLLNHSSGMPGTYWNRAATLSPDTNYHTFVLQQLAKDYPNFPPDFVNAYNNNGFTLVEDVVASASGTNFAAFVSGNLFAPMGMFGSTYFGAEPVARSYVNGVRYPDEIINVAGGGGIYSSALDMGQYIQTLLAWGRSPMDIAVLKSNSVSALWANETTNVSVPVTEKTFKFGLGWDCIADPEFDYAGTAPWKSGGSVTFGGLLEIIPSRGLGVIVFNNYPGGERVAHPVARAALRWALKDKFNLDWPTNRFVPLVSPVTNLPIAELDAVTGCYAIAGGYDLVQRDGTNLTWIGNAQSESPFIITNLVARENGWFSTPASQDIEICFSNVAGHVVMSLRQVIGTYGVYQDTSARGERIAPVALSAAWSNRLDRLYFMSDLVPDSYFWLPAFDISLRILPREDALFVEGDVVSSSLLVPDSDTLAFPRGLGLEAADATALQAFTTNGIEYLRYGGFTYQPADSYPEFEPETVTNLSLDAGEVMWFSMPITSGTVYTLDLTSTNLVAAYIIDTDGNRAGKILTAYGMTFTPLTDGDYRIAVFSDGADPTSCQLASYTNGLPFYRQVDAAEWPAALTNYLEWYGG
ncbi:MAG: beta-lactamase family protein, partial [Verrucomicrobia bacterium]|nr:beta-lactamase family protein [Verrucomicrobiota bacterium]